MYESELKVMQCIWDDGGTPNAIDLVKTLNEHVGWNKNTTYTVIKKLVAKGYVERIDPGFRCRPLITREEVEKSRTSEIVDRFHGGSHLMFLSAFVKNHQLSQEEMHELKTLIDSWSENGNQ